MRRIFIYGTLRRGAANHRVLERTGAVFERGARTAARYDLVDLGLYPALLGEGPLAISGEVWVVDESATAELDRFEGAPDLYVRSPIELDDGSVVEAYVYARPTTAKRIDSGAWK